MALHLEHQRLAVADVDDAGVLAGAVDDPRLGGGELGKPPFRGLVGAVLAPHDREDTELGVVGRAPHDVENAPVLLAAEAVLGGQIEGAGGDRRAHDSAATKPSNTIRPSPPPSAGSARRSGCGIIPSTVLWRLKMPAMFSAEPLGLAAASGSPPG